MFGRIHLGSHLVPGFHYLGGFFFFITASISLGVICLSDSLILPDLVLEGCMFLGIYPFSPGCPPCWHIFSYNPFCFFGVSCYFSSFISDFTYLGPLSFFLDESG